MKYTFNRITTGRLRGDGVSLMVINGVADVDEDNPAIMKLVERAGGVPAKAKAKKSQPKKKAARRK